MIHILCFCFHNSGPLSAGGLFIAVWSALLCILVQYEKHYTIAPVGAMPSLCPLKYVHAYK